MSSIQTVFNYNDKSEEACFMSNEKFLQSCKKKDLAGTADNSIEINNEHILV